MSHEQRRLAAILVADVAGFSRLVGADETGTLARLAALRRDIVDPNVASHSGRLFKATGDGFLVEFASAVQAVTCAMEIQKAAGPNALPLRIGIHVGDVVVQGDDLMGDGVNIAARIEGIAEPGGIAVSRAVHEQVRDRLDVAFVDRGEIELKNIGRPVHIFAVGSKSAPAAPALALPDKPSIAALPFTNMSGDPEQEYFVDGLVEDIITALSRTKSLFVIARDSSFAYKDARRDIREIGQTLGVRYVLEGSIRKAADEIRITARLSDAPARSQIWAQRFDARLDNVFQLQDDITTRVVSAIGPRLEQAEISRSSRRPTGVFRSYDYYLQGLRCLYLQSTEANDEAIAHFRQAGHLDPEFARSFALAAYALSRRKSFGWSDDLARDAADAEPLLRQALNLDRQDPNVLSAAGWTLAFLIGNVDEGVALLDAATELDPNLFMGWLWRGWGAVMKADPNAVSFFERALRLSPIDPRVPSAQSGIASAHFQAGRYDEAVSWAMKAIAQRPNHLAGHLVAMVAHALAGRIDEARSLFTQYQKRDPAARISNMNLLRLEPRHFAKWADGYRLAGMPE